MKTKNKSNNTYIILIGAMLIFAALIVAFALFMKGQGNGDDTSADTDADTDTNTSVSTSESTDTDTDTDDTTDTADSDTTAEETTTEDTTAEETTAEDTTVDETTAEDTTIEDTTSADTTDDKTPPAVDANDGKTIICIDPGHGFDDIGCSTDLIYDIEAVITLDIAKRLQTELLKHDVTVILTHDGDSFPSASNIRNMADEYDLPYDGSRIIRNNVFSAYERVIYANAVHRVTPIDFFVSIHVNSIVGHPELSQYEMYYYEGSPYIDLIEAFTDSLRDKLDNESVTIAKGPTDAYTVTRWADFPSVLIETGYATNEDDAEKLNSADWRQSFAELLALEILTALGVE